MFHGLIKVNMYDCVELMPSFLHEALIELFRNCPEMAASLLQDTLHVDLPDFEYARAESLERSRALHLADVFG